MQEEHSPSHPPPRQIVSGRVKVIRRVPVTSSMMLRTWIFWMEGFDYMQSMIFPVRELLLETVLLGCCGASRNKADAQM